MRRLFSKGLLIIPLTVFMGFTYRGCSLLEVLFFTNCSPGPEPFTINSFGLAWDETIIEVGDEGRIYLSDNHCLSGYTLLTVSNEPDLNDITFFPHPNAGNIIVGDNGTLIRLTPDLQLSGLNNPAGIYNLNALSDPGPYPLQEPYLIAAGDMGTVIKSTDYGLTWFQLNFPYTYNLKDCWTDYLGTVWVSGDDYSLFSTTDDGKTWIPRGPSFQKLSASQSSYNKIYFYDDDLGFIGGPHGLILKTTDGGNIWQTKVAQGFSEVYDIYFVSPDSGAAVGPGGIARFTTDGGDTWFEDEIVTNYLDGRDVKKIIPFGKNYGSVVGSGGLNTFIAPDSTYLDSIGSVTSVQDDLLIPSEFVLYQNYPNPFNPSTVFEFVIPKSSFVNLKIYDVLGKEAAVLVNEEKRPGKYKIEFNASGLSSGVYYYQLTAGDFKETKKIILIK